MFRLALLPRLIELPCLFFRFQCTPCSNSLPQFVVRHPRRVAPAKLVSALSNFTPEAGPIRAFGHQAAPWNSGANVGIVNVAVKLHRQLAEPSMFRSGALLVRKPHRMAVNPRVVDPNRPALVLHHCCSQVQHLCCESKAPGNLSTKRLQITTRRQSLSRRALITKLTTQRLARGALAGGSLSQTLHRFGIPPSDIDAHRAFWLHVPAMRRWNTFQC